MRIGSARPAGYRLTRGFGGKVKMMNFTVLPPPNYNWAVMWGAQYDASRNLQWLQTIRAAGFNAVRIFTSNTPFDGPTPYVNSWPSLATFRVRAAEFAAQCRSNGLLLNITLAGNGTCVFGPNGDQGASVIPGILEYVKIWMDVAADIIVYFDGANEMNLTPLPLTWADSANARARSDLTGYFQALRSVTGDVPLTISATSSNSTEITAASSQWYDLQFDMGCDFHDVHCYWGKTTFPSSAHFAAFEQRTKFLGRYIVSEIGSNQSWTDQETAGLLSSVGDISARERCMGVGLWCIAPQDTDPSNDLGYTSDVAGTQVRAIKAQHTAAWPRTI